MTGDDAWQFLQGQFTNDLRSLERASGSVYGLWLNTKGRVLADSFVVREGAAIWVGSYFSPAAVIRERLESFVVADDVVVEDCTGDFVAFSLFPGGESPGGDLPAFGITFGGRRRRAGNREWVVPRDRADEVRRTLAGWSECGPAQLEAWRIAEGIPAVPRDIGPGELPNEGGLEVDAISYSKGCYLGQEVMARLKSMGQVRRRLVRVRGELAPGSALPLPLWRESRQVGELRSWVVPPDGGGGNGLALVTLMHVTAGVRLALEANGEPRLEMPELP